MSTQIGPDDTRRTLLYECHRELKAKMVPFGGWLMPVSYSTPLTEHKAVREQVGVFDVSHMGEVLVTGPDAETFLQRLTINDIQRLKDGTGQYSAILNEAGGMIDDLIIYRLAADRYLICVNASNTEKDFSWIAAKARAFGPTVHVTDESSRYSQLAIQGPNSRAATEKLLASGDRDRLGAMAYMQIDSFSVLGTTALIARTGYTGEHGYELYLPNGPDSGTPLVVKVWKALLEGAPVTGLKPVGLGARDTLRLEACYLLYGNDMNDEVSPLEAGIAWAVRMDSAKGDFVGRAALERQKAAAVPRQLAAFVMEGDGIPRHGMAVFLGDRLVGEVTSGSVLPTVGGAGGLALITAGLKVGTTVEVDVRGKRKLARLIAKPLYKAKVKG